MIRTRETFLIVAVVEEIVVFECCAYDQRDGVKAVAGSPAFQVAWG